MGKYSRRLKRKKALSELSDVYGYVSYDSNTGVEYGTGEVAIVGDTGAGLIEVEIMKDSYGSDAFKPGTKVYVDDDAEMNGQPIPLKDSTGTEIGVDVVLTSKRDATVIEEIVMLKRRIAALENPE